MDPKVTAILDSWHVAKTHKTKGCGAVSTSTESNSGTTNRNASETRRGARSRSPVSVLVFTKTLKPTCNV